MLWKSFCFSPKYSKQTKNPKIALGIYLFFLLNFTFKILGLKNSEKFLGLKNFRAKIFLKKKFC